MVTDQRCFFTILTSSRRRNISNGRGRLRRIVQLSGWRWRIWTGRSPIGTSVTNNGSVKAAPPRWPTFLSGANAALPVSSSAFWSQPDTPWSTASNPSPQLWPLPAGKVSSNSAMRASGLRSRLGEQPDSGTETGARAACTRGATSLRSNSTTRPTAVANSVLQIQIKINFLYL